MAWPVNSWPVQAWPNAGWPLDSIRFLLDSLPTTAFATSTRRLISTYSGPAMRVRRSSDNAEMDIPFTDAGDLDETVLLTFVGANSAFVVRMYDQSGYMRDLTQATAANQPRIVNAGVIDRIATAANRPGYRTNGVSQSMATGSFVVPQPLTRNSVLRFNDPLSASQPAYFDNLLGSAQGASLVSLINGSLQGFYGGASGLATSAGSVSAGTSATLTEVLSGVSSVISLNGTVTSGDLSGGLGISGITVGCLRSSARPANATFSDTIIFPSAISTASRLALEANQKTYYGTP